MSVKIFDQRFFSSESEFRKLIRESLYTSKDEPEDDDRWNIDKISIFDYILGNRLDVFPFDEKHVYYDWCSYKNLSGPSIGKWDAMAGSTYTKVVNSIPVHEDLFRYAYNINLASFYVGFFMYPQNYRILCMQWDAYYQVGYLVLGRIEKCSHDENNVMETPHYSQKPNQEWPTCQNLLGGSTNYDILCNQLCDPLDPITVDSNMILNICEMFCSDFGIKDYATTRMNSEIYKQPVYEIWNVGYAIRHPSTHAELHCGETFFSDIYGCF